MFYGYVQGTMMDLNGGIVGKIYETQHVHNVLTVPELQHHGKHLFANAAERKEKYTELRARFAKDLYPQKKEEDAQMKINRRPIANPE